MESMLERAQKLGTPLIDGGSATFLWHGAGDLPHLIGDFTGWGREPMRLAEIEPGVWGCTLSFPRDAYVEYQFVLRYDISERVADPLNPRLVYNGVDSVNHWFAMPEYPPPELIRRKPGVARGAISEHWLETDVFTGDTHRKLYLYHPPVEEPTPLVIVWDQWRTHGAPEVKALVRRHPRDYILEKLPTYAPDLNPEEGCNSEAKAELRNALPANVAELRQQTRRAFLKVARNPHSLRGYFHHAGLSLKGLS